MKKIELKRNGAGLHNFEIVLTDGAASTTAPVAIRGKKAMELAEGMTGEYVRMNCASCGREILPGEAVEVCTECMSCQSTI